MRLRNLRFFVITLLVSSTVFAQGPSAASSIDLLNRLNETLTRTEKTFPAETATVRILDQNIREIRDAATKARQQLPAEYLDPLEVFDQKLKAATQIADANSVHALLSQLTNDIASRLNLMHAGKELGIRGVPTKVKVTVRTYKNADEIGGYEVRANPRGLGKAKPEYYLFGKTNPSSPPSQQVVYGDKIFWAIYAEQIAGETYQHVGDTIEITVRIDVKD